MRWRLEELYTSFDSEEYKGDLGKLKEEIVDFKEWANSLKDYSNYTNLIEDYINFNLNIVNLFSKLRSFAYLSFSVNVRDEKALQESDNLSVMYSDITEPETKFQHFIKNIDNLDEIINKSDLLKEHRFYLHQIKLGTRYILSEKEEVLISKLSNTGSNAWENLQDKISSTLLVDIELDDKKERLPLSVIRNLAYDKDPNIRKTAYKAEIESYKKIEEVSAAALNGIKGEVITITELRGFKSPLDEALFKSRMDRETLDAMITAMEESLPIFHKYFKKKADLLGYDNGLPFYDIFAPIGEVNMHFTYKEAMDYIINNFRTFSDNSDNLADYTKEAHDNNWLDVEPRDGKRGGAFCSNLHPIGESRILSNFSGSFSDMITLAHELGHGYHGLNLRDESILNSRYPMPIAETASIMCETIVTNAALKEANDKERLTILEASISDATQVIVDIYSRFLFESELFEKRKDYSLSVNELKEIMINSQKKAYGDGLDHNILHPYMWVNKPHYYSSGLSFYNFPYAFGLLFSKGLYGEYLNKGKEFVKEYDDLLNATGKNTVEDVALKAGIDIHNPDFFRNSLKLVEKDIEEFIELADK